MGFVVRWPVPLKIIFQLNWHGAVIGCSAIHHASVAEVAVAWQESRHQQSDQVFLDLATATRRTLRVRGSWPDLRTEQEDATENGAIGRYRTQQQPTCSKSQRKRRGAERQSGVGTSHVKTSVFKRNIPRK